MGSQEWAGGVVKLLLNKDTELESEDEDGQTPLLWAAKDGHEAVFDLMLNKGAELEAEDMNCQTSLSWAARNGHEALVKLMLDKGANLEAKTRKARHRCRGQLAMKTEQWSS
jgi:ankyrin repeat protein